MCRYLLFLLGLFLSASLPTSAPAQSVPRSQEGPKLLGKAVWGMVQVRDEYLAEQIERLAERSPRFRAAFDTLRFSPFPIIVMQDREFREATGSLPRPGHVLFVPGPRGVKSPEVGLAFVMVDADAIVRDYTLLGGEGAEQTDIQIILAHELYAHVVPVAATGLITSGCPDPSPLQSLLAPDVQGCSTKRENLVREDLDAAERPSYRELRLTRPELWRVAAMAYRRIPPAVSAPPAPPVRGTALVSRFR